MRHLIILIALLCAACSSTLPSIKPYRMDIQQGNVVNSKMMLQLRPDMTKSQVRFIMGTPLVQDSFHKDRWDYLYQMRKAGKLIEQRHVILEFEGDMLKRVRGNVIPVDAEGNVVAGAAVKSDAEKSLADKLKFWKSDEERREVYVGQETPAALVNPAYAPKPAAVPVVPATPKATDPRMEPAPTPESGVNVTPLPDNSPQAAPISGESSPAAKPAVPASSGVVAPAAVSTPQAAPAAKPAAQAKPDDDDLPPEDSPGYFERMLEKIGF